MNFEDISKKLKKLSQDTVTEVQKLNEIRQLNSRINEEKKKLSNVYMEMGKKLYEMCKEAPLEGFEEEMRAVEEKYSMIDLLQDQIRGVKGVVLCTCCNTEVAATERFCSNCGNKMPEVLKIEENEAEVLDGEVVDDADETVEEAAEVVEEETTEAEEDLDTDTSEPEDTETAEEEIAEADAEVVEENAEEAEEKED